MRRLSANSVSNVASLHRSIIHWNAVYRTVGCRHFCVCTTNARCRLTEVFLTLTEVFPCFFLTCKANARVKLANTWHGPHSSTLVVICVVRLLFVLLYVLFVCKCVLPPGDNPIAVNKYIISSINNTSFLKHSYMFRCIYSISSSWSVLLCSLKLQNYPISLTNRYLLLLLLQGPGHMPQMHRSL